jgi:hypothetical protein
LVVFREAQNLPVEGVGPEASDGRVGLTVGEGVNQFFIYPAQAKLLGEFTQAVIQVSEVRAAVEELRGRGVEFEEYDTPETRTENGIARTPDGGEGAWFKDSEGNLLGLVRALPSKFSQSARGGFAPGPARPERGDRRRLRQGLSTAEGLAR